MGRLKKSVKRFLRQQATPARIGMVSRLVPRSVVLAGQRANLKRQVEWAAANSPFYKKKFKELGIKPEAVSGIGDLRDLWTTPKEVLELGEQMCCVPPQIAFETTGSSGRNKRIYFVNEEINRATSHISTAFSLYGFTPKDRFLNAYNFSFWVPGVLHQKAVEKFEAFCLPAGKVEPEEIYSRLEPYKINVLLGYPSLLMRVTELAEAGGAPPMKGIMASGERLPPHIRRWMESVWNCKVYMGYGCTESCGGIGGECVHQNGYHIDELDRIVEIERPDSDGFGEIILTTLGRKCMPLLRYRLGDVGRLETSACTCGLPTARIMEIAGRADDKVTLGCVDFYPTLFEKVVADVPELTADFQLQAWWEGRKEVLELAVETDAQPARVEPKIRAALLTHDPDMVKNASLGMFHLKFRYEKPRTLREGIKLNRFVDKRKEQEQSKQ